MKKITRNLIDMNKDNLSALIMAIAVVALIAGFAIYFNSPSLNKASTTSTQRQVEKFVSAATIKNGSLVTIKLDKDQFQHIDKSQFVKAPEFAQISGYINTPNNNSPITLSSLKGKVVLVDFWTYSCINCIRTIPHLNDWNQKYADKGLVIVGVHSPEFEFEKNYDNVKAAVQRFGITYPVILDSDHGTWNAYGNQYWPRDYLIDSQGYIRDNHIGEGGYDQTEKAIQSLLAERASQMGMKEISFNTKPTEIKPGSLQSVDLNQSTTPEIYLGYSKARAPIGNPEGFRPDQTVSYSIPSNTNFQPSIVYLQGYWKNNPDNMELQSDTGRIALIYYAKSANIVAGGTGGGIVSNDKDKAATVGVEGGGHGQEVPAANLTAVRINNSLGKDLADDGSFRIDGQRLYNLSMHTDYNVHSMVIDIKGKGFQLYTFTFG
jgi:thiol-disulfide isomerase/thioredoxin